ncbi:amino-acid N-acetyltransferase [Sandaracinus amylolyticus]|uniref:amino-acid N-acetyltransferase n=1 Tax=Sandaracinus amylolyticus TaxID=927083 RepID=UPI001EFF6360|nr:amino-acid N-acetyltransferase [Sandaracinus amylolyticus]UJR82174.1 Amino-acid N-acetyltransferase [Sandaracinus amylolyticus]
MNGQAPSSFVDFFRLSAPYIHAHRGRTFVVMFGGEAVVDSSFPNLIHDVALMHALGVRVVLVHGSKPQIEERMRERNLRPRFHKGMRVTDPATMRCVEDAVGNIRMRIEGLLSMGLPSSPMAHSRIRVASGNFVVARPRGVRDGVDYQLTGGVRRIDVEGVKMRLDSGAIVLLSPLGYSPAGEAYNLSSHEVAASAAVALGADKLVQLVEGRGVVDRRKRLIPQLGPVEAEELVEGGKHLHPDTIKHLAAAARACREGVRRTHLVERQLDGALLQELFTREGRGTLVTAERYEDMRGARIDDIPGMLELLRPLEEAGILVRRSRETLENEIDRFTVVERDGMIIGCAGLEAFPDEKTGELYCLAVDGRYREKGRGEAIVEYTAQKARAMGLETLFVLTTQTTDWFRERGFQPAGVRALPEARRARYDRKRRSKVLVRDLSEELIEDD